jgi:nitrite reductase (NADH) large subunit
MAERESLLIIGNGMAAMRLLQELEERAPGRFRVTVVGAETQPAYNRVLLSPFLAGEICWADVCLKPADWYAERDIRLLLGDAAIALDPAGKTVTLASGRMLAFDACVLATGSAPIRLPIPGNALPGVRTFRDVADVEAMAEAVKDGAPAVVIGGGLLGIEAAYGLARRGVAVTLVHIMDRLMERQLDAEAAGLLKKALEAKGVSVLIGAETAEIAGETRVEAVRLKDGRALLCGLVVMAAGIRPEASLARAAGLSVERGVLIDDCLKASHQGIFAIGECAQHRGACYGLVEPAYEQAAALAGVLAGEATAYPGTVIATNLKVSGVPVFSAGDFEGAGAEHIIYRDGILPAYRKLVLRGDRLVGAVLYGDTADSLWYLDLIRSARPILAMRAVLAFGQAYAEAA